MAAKSPEPKGAARGQGLFAAIIAEATCYNYYMFHPGPHLSDSLVAMDTTHHRSYCMFQLFRH